MSIDHGLEKIPSGIEGFDDITGGGFGKHA